MRHFSILFLVVAATLATHALPPTIQAGNLAEIASYINKLNTTWKADPYADSATPSLGFIPDPSISKSLQAPFPEDLPLPVHFDARHHWPDCRSVIDNIRDQGHCGSCWAEAAASVISDRICISTKGKTKLSISTEDVACGINDGCGGGMPYFAFTKFFTDGYVTGGEFGSALGCKPYTLHNCSHHVNGSLPPCSTFVKDELHCEAKCGNPLYGRTYKGDLQIGQGNVTNFEGEKSMMAEIATNGPVSVAFAVFEDFLTYKGGVYQHKTGSRLGGHAVRVIGWGEEAGGVKYWTVANSWNREWGEGGFFRIRRGNDECGLESMRVVAPVIG